MIVDRFDPLAVRDVALGELGRPPERVYLGEPAERPDPNREWSHEPVADPLAALDTQASRYDGQGPAAEAKRAARQPSTT